MEGTDPGHCDLCHFGGSVCRVYGDPSAKQDGADETADPWRYCTCPFGGFCRFVGAQHPNKGQFICGASLSLVLALVLGLASNYISVATGTLTEIGTVRTEYTPVAVYVLSLIHI